MLPAQTLFTLFKVKKCTINRNEAYRSSIRLPQLRDTSSTYFKTKKNILIPTPLFQLQANILKKQTAIKSEPFPTHFSHGFLENDNNYKVEAKILKGAKMFPLAMKMLHNMHAHIITTENSTQSSFL